MNYARIVRLGIISSIFFLFSAEFLSGQSLGSISASFSEQTSYPVFTGKDFIYYYCGTNGHQSGALKANSSGSSVTFKWEKYSDTSGFIFFSNETGVSSTITGLANATVLVLEITELIIFSGPGSSIPGLLLQRQSLIRIVSRSNFWEV